MEPRSEPTNLVWPFPFTSQDWAQTPPAVQAYLCTVRDELRQLHERVDTLEARLAQHSTTSSRPPSSDNPYKKPRQRMIATTPRKAGGKPGHQGHRQVLLPPTTVHEMRPERCACGNTTFAVTTPSHTHQVIELPLITMEVTHWVLHQGWCQGCGRWSQAHVPTEHTAGYGPRFSALIGELAGTYGNGRRMVQSVCASVLGVPISLGAIQKVLDRVTQAIDPYYAVIAQQARQARVNYIDETPWYCLNAREWLWVRASERVAFYMIHPRRSKEAFTALIDDWTGILVSDGYGVYQTWVERRQTCLAHLIRTARSLAERQHAELAACGTWALAELQRLCHMATAPPTGGEWRAWYARLCKLSDQYHDRRDDAGRLVRRLLREMDSLWVFLAHYGVEPTNNRAERALRFGVLWHKRSRGTTSEKGNRWVERILSLKETCRLQARATYAVLVDAVTCFFHGKHPALSWITAGGSTSAHSREVRTCMLEDSTMRRSTIALILPLALGLLVAPLTAEAQQADKVYRIGFLSTTPPPAHRWDALLDGLRERGYREGQNLVFERRFSEGNAERFPEFAAELVRLSVDCIIVTTTPAALAAKHATQTIPIVIPTAIDPVEAGLVASLARPGGNLTGLSILAPELSGKRLELLQEVMPGRTRVAVLWNAANPANALAWQETQVAARTLGLLLHSQDVRGPQDLEGAFARMAQARPEALLVLGDALLGMHRPQITAFATQQHLPSVFAERAAVVAGGLMSYGPSLPDLYRRTASYVDKLLKGTTPADLPVEQPMKCELVINMKTAQSLNLTIPPSILFQADEVIR
jgi:transposase